MEVQDT